MAFSHVQAAEATHHSRQNYTLRQEPIFLIEVDAAMFNAELTFLIEVDAAMFNAEPTFLIEADAAMFNADLNSKTHKSIVRHSY